jgi:hypothetical protein
VRDRLICTVATSVIHVTIMFAREWDESHETSRLPFVFVSFESTSRMQRFRTNSEIELVVVLVGCCLNEKQMINDIDRKHTIDSALATQEQLTEVSSSMF